MRYCLFAYVLFLSVVSCSKQNSEFLIKIKVLEETKGIPIPHAKILIGQITEPLLSMQGEKKIFDGNTDNQGELMFRVQKSKSYNLYVYPKDKLEVTITDSILGGIGIEGDDLEKNQVIEILCKSE